MWKKAAVPLIALAILITSAGCATSTGADLPAIPCVTLPGVLTYDPADTQETVEWGDRFRAQWEAFCQ